MATTILVIRHGETAWNRSKIFRGTYDIPLNDNGKNQAQLLADALKDRTIDAAWTSPLSRSRETAEIVMADRGVDAIVDERLADINYGDWTGKEEAKVAQQWPDLFDLWATQPEKVQFPNGETLEQLYSRTSDAMDSLAATHDGKTIALFAHRAVNKILVLAALGLPPARFPFIRQDNCCLTEFQRNENGYVIVTLNSTSHIDKSGTDLLTADF